MKQILQLNKDKPLIMGILNMTDDSFSGDGLLLESLGYLLQRVENFINEGADILDIGGESTRPGARQISVDEEYARTITPITMIHQKFPNAMISIDTMKAEIAEAAMKAGASIINDVSAGEYDKNMANVASETGAMIVLMHNSARSDAVEKMQELGSSYQAIQQDDIMAVINKKLSKNIQSMLDAGVKREQLILDPGIGFGKTLQDNLAIINQLDKLKQFNLPILLGASRKSFIGKLLDVTADERLIGSLIAAMMGQMRGADIIRVHDVKETVQAQHMLQALMVA